MTYGAVLGWGCAVPQHFVTQQEAAEHLLAAAPSLIRHHEPRWRRIFEHSRIQKRHTVLTHETLRQWQQEINPATVLVRRLQQRDEAGVVALAPSELVHNGQKGPTTGWRMRAYGDWAVALAEPAARQAIARSGCPSQSISHLITASCTGFSAPGADVQLIRRLHLSAEVMRLHIGYMGCHASINALRAAQGFLAHSPSACVLVCCVELCSLHWQYTSEAEKWLGNVLFADGAAALVLARHGPENSWKLRDTASVLLADTEELMRWTIGDHGFEMYVSPQLPMVLRRTVRDWLGNWLQRHGLSLQQVGSWAVHPGGPKILEAVAEALGLSETALGASWHILAQYGNMSSPSVLFVLEHLGRQNAPRPVVAVAFGPGLTLEAALFE